MNISTTIWINGKIEQENVNRPSIASHSLQYGVAIFDGIMAYCNANCYYLHYGIAHYTRFIESASKLGFNPLYSPEQLVAETLKLLETQPMAKYYVRPFIFRPNQHIALAGDMSNEEESIAIILLNIPNTNAKKSIKCTISKYERVSARSIPVQWKVSAAYTNSYLVRSDAEKKGFNDGIMMNREGYICEASAANIFFIKEGTLYTPAINEDIFSGITRQIIMEIALQNNIPIEEINIHCSELSQFTGCFLCATLMEIVPVNRIDNIFYNTDIDNIFRVLNFHFDKLISNAQ